MIQNILELKKNDFDIYTKVFDTFNDKRFPCIYGKLSFQKKLMYAGIYNSLSSEQISNLADDLRNMSKLLDTQISTDEKKFNTFIAIFNIDDSEIFFYDIWIKIISILHKFDTKDWENNTTSDLNNPEFKFSFDGKLWYPVLITPNHWNIIRKSKITILSFQPDQTFILNKKIDSIFYQNIRKKIHQKIDKIYNKELPHYLSKEASGKGIVQFLGYDFEKEDSFIYPSIFN